jgi:hypothetical protein
VEQEDQKIAAFALNQTSQNASKAIVRAQGQKSPARTWAMPPVASLFCCLMILMRRMEMKLRMVMVMAHDPKENNRGSAHMIRLESSKKLTSIEKLEASGLTVTEFARKGKLGNKRNKMLGIIDPKLEEARDQSQSSSSEASSNFTLPF